MSEGFGGPSTPTQSNTGQGQTNMAAPTPTPVGGRAFCSPAMVRILLTPASADVTPDEFERMTSAIRRIESIRISDLPLRSSGGSNGPSQRKERIPSTSPLARSGEVHISFITSYDPSHSFLSPFNVHKQILGVLGLSTCSSSNAMEELERAPAALRQLHPTAVVHRVFGFDVGAARPQTMDLSALSNARAAIEKAGGGSMTKSSSSATGMNVEREVPEGGDMGEESLSKISLDSSMTRRTGQTKSSITESESSGFAGRSSTGLVIFPAVRKDLKDVRFYLKTLIPQFVADLIDGLDDFVNGLQGKPLETPRETLEGPSANASGSSTSNALTASNKGLGAAATSAASRASALFSSFSATEDPSSSSISRKVSRTSKNILTPAGVGPTGAGRYAKVKADYYLLVGDLWSAAKEYDNCMSLMGKERAMAGGQDAVWYASALEGWSVTRVLTIRMGGQVAEKAPCTTMPLGGVKEKEKEKIVSEFQFAGKDWSDIAEAYNLALTIYSKCLAPASYLLDTMRSVNPETPRDYTHPLIHTSACLAYSRLLLAIWASGGWNGETFDQLLLGGVPPALAETTRPSPAVYMQHSTSSGISRSDIAAPASLSLTNSSTNALKMLDQIHLYSSLAAIYGCVGFARKEAYAIQRLQSLVVILIAQGVHMQKQQGSSISEALRAGNAAYGTMSTQLSSIGGGLGSDSILVLALQICQTYGINVQLMPLLDMDRGHILLRASVDVKSGKRLSSPMLNRNRAAWSMSSSSPGSGNEIDWKHFLSDEAQARQAAISELLEEPHFGWIEQQIAILKDTISICEMLQDKQSLLFFGAILLRDFWPYLGFEEQFRLKDGFAKLMGESISGDIGTANNNKNLQLQYWGPKDLLAGMQLESGTTNQPQKVFFKNLPREGKTQSVPEWAKSKEAKNTQLTTESGLMQDEEASFIVTLHNPLQIPLELESIRLELQTLGSLGPTFEPNVRRNVILPPNAFHVVRLSGIASGEGRLSVKGIYLKLPFCAERLFTYEYAQGIAQKTLWKAQSELDDKWTRTKRIGLDARGSGSTGIGLQTNLQPKSRSRTQDSLWILPVIAKIPLVEVRPSAGLKSGSVILCDGEEKAITLTLQNKGEMVVDHIQFIFDDDVQRDTVELLAEGQLEAVDVYELEQDLIERPFLSLMGKETKNKEAMQDGVKLEVNEAKTFTFRIRGKLDVRRASIRVQFGNKANSRELGREYFWTRQAQFSFDVRVLPTVFLDGLEVMRARNIDLPSLKSMLENGNDLDKYTDLSEITIVSLAAHNTNPGGEIAICMNVDDSIGSQKIVRRLPAHSSIRIHFLLPNALPKNIREELLQPIPKLVERQFIVSNVKRTESQERILRALFWARQKILTKLSNSMWKDVQTRKTGSIGLSGLRLDNPQSIVSLYADPIDVQTTVSKGVQIKAEVEGSVELLLETKAHDFVELHFEVKNKSDAIVENLQYRLAANIDDKQLSQHILCVGGHMHGYISQLLPNESQTVSIGICFLTKGSFLLDYLITPSRSALSQTNEEDTSKADEAVSITSFLTANARYSYKSIKVHVH